LLDLYPIDRSELDFVPRTELPNPYDNRGRPAPTMKMFNEPRIEAIALDIHGGPIVLSRPRVFGGCDADAREKRASRARASGLDEFTR
jgi:hypothetical protein